MIYIFDRNVAHILLSSAYNIHSNFKKVVIGRFLTLSFDILEKEASAWQVFLKFFFTCIFSTTVCLSEVLSRKYCKVTFRPRSEAPVLSRSLLMKSGELECMLQVFVKSLSKVLLFYVVLRETGKPDFLSMQKSGPFLFWKISKLKRIKNIYTPCRHCLGILNQRKCAHLSFSYPNF